MPTPKKKKLPNYNIMYKTTRSFESRIQETQRMKTKHPDRIPILVEPRPNAPPIDKRKYMAPKDLVFSQFIYVIRKRLQIKPEHALFFFNENTLISSQHTLAQIYADRQDKDGFLYVAYDSENTFGSAYRII